MAKRYLAVVIMLLYSWRLRVGDWRVGKHVFTSIFQMLANKRETLEMAIKSYILIELNRIREKSFLEVLVFGHPYCSTINSTQFNVQRENTCSFPCHIGSSIPTFRDMYLHVIVRKKKFYNFCVKFTIYEKNSNF